MVNRRSKRKSKYAKKDVLGASGWIGISIGTLSIALIVGLLLVSQFNKSPLLDSVSLCQIDTELVGSMAILIDTTDKIQERSSRSAQVYLAKKIDSVPENTLISVFVMSEDSSSHITPLISRCKPSDGSTASELTQNPVLMKRRFQEEFYVPFSETLNGLFDKEPADYSPILESLQSISIEAFQPYPDSVEKRLLVISDLLQHSTNYSMYAEQPDYSHYKQRAETAGQYSLTLKDVEVEFLVLPREVPKGNRADVVSFWQALLVEKSAMLGSSMVPM